MATRGAIARLNGNGGFKGAYHHWDSYPEGLGKTLYHLYHGFFKRDLEAMLKYLIDDHPAGWSTINGADFSLPAKWWHWPNENSPCEICGKENWRHYRQYYEKRNEELPPEELWSKENDVLVLGHSSKHSWENQPAHGPICHCHGENGNLTGSQPFIITEENAAGSGVEWVYAFDEEKKEMHILASYSNGKKMIGMFGCGDPNAEWKTVRVVKLDGPEPRWSSIK